MWNGDFGSSKFRRGGEHGHCGVQVHNAGSCIEHVVKNLEHGKAI